MNRWLALVLVAAAFGLGFQWGDRTAPERALVAAEAERRAAIWDAAFLVDLDGLPTDREMACEQVIDTVRDLLDAEALATSAARAALPSR